MAELPGGTRGTRDISVCSGPEGHPRAEGGAEPVPADPAASSDRSAGVPAEPADTVTPTGPPVPAAAVPAEPAVHEVAVVSAADLAEGEAAAWASTSPPQSMRARLLAGAVCALAMVVVGPLLGLLWAACAPHLDVAAVLAGAMSVFSVQSTVDAYFAMICAVAGVIGGLVTYWRAADVGWPVAVGLGAGGVAGSLLAGEVGRLRRSDAALDSLPPNATDLLRDLADFHVRATGLYLVLPGVALLVLALALWAGGTTFGWPRRRR
ncbi:hypothetical protein Ga0074812_12841 [Parafrankia irregularis]|uniref:Uncharacterized protein n=1 Tax=Parafrankia irregularis TaxID=795642 RepID=A0A0S4QWH3_9ACTN|nr:MULTISPECIES: hypothetical protein [Parafrankia]MBE3201940.1 hypothetical protein [Parafrankia sp. CH37]CUU59471.1 hypothetical protein Ga0074812_12841 [Parafrankia irregularis]